MAQKTGQTSLEFLYAVAMVLLVFTMSTVLFYQSQQDSTAITSFTQSKLVCQAVASRISAVAAGGDGTASIFSLPLVAGGTNYTIFISGKNRTVSVSHQGGGTGCLFSTSNISNGSASSFYIASDTPIRNVQGGVLVG
ncbi:MAG: hypothetical protein NTV88_05750 [Candidatus Micrarchaeota archaeon]|nr:hypothetical protein [Candidatus Micrarchaeota archaeon]